MNIPIYRAKKFDSDEWVEGYYDGGAKIIISLVGSTTRKHDGTIHNYRASLIYKDTLAIHFPNMIDKNGKKIFASLSEDGVGGDIRDGNWVIFYSDGCIKHSSLDDKLEHISNYRGFEKFEVIGIHKGE